MPLRLARALLLLAGLSAPAAAQPHMPQPQPQPQPQPLLPEAFVWFSPPNNPLLRAAWVLGSEAGSGPYVLRVQLAAGGRIAAHIHPDTRHTTVLSGSLWVGFGAACGAERDGDRPVAVPAGAVYLVPAGVLHCLWAKDGEVVYQESGQGPTGTRLLPERSHASQRVTGGFASP